MIGQTSGIEKSSKATAVVGQYLVAKFGADDEHIAKATAVTDGLIGVIQNAAAAAEDEVRVMFTGISNIVYGDTVVRGDKLTVDSNGKAVPVTRHIHVENTAGTYAQNANTAAASAVNIIGIALVSGAANDIGKALLTPSLA